jgi:hypothetical protein
MGGKLPGVNKGTAICWMKRQFLEASEAFRIPGHYVAHL